MSYLHSSYVDNIPFNDCENVLEDSPMIESYQIQKASWNCRVAHHEQF